ncbi:MAG: DUF1254 domain-containing protein [Desulfobacteraceae bacterium]|nr:DUF1254 domain-containing protein [Desulfobacteraceae bacterium]
MAPTVVYLPTRMLGILDDMAFLHMTDLGVAAPDKGKGGKYLAVASDYEGDIQEGHFEVRSKYSNRLTLGIRTFPGAEGSDEAAVELGPYSHYRPIEPLGR